MSESEAGRALDALVAEKVMGWTPVKVLHRSEGDIYLYVAPGRPAEVWNAVHARRYSTDIAAAWEVVEHIEPGYCVSVERTSSGEWHCVVWCHVEEFERLSHEVYADTAPLAICRAVLAAREALP